MGLYQDSGPGGAGGGSTGIGPEGQKKEIQKNNDLNAAVERQNSHQGEGGGGAPQGAYGGGGSKESLPVYLGTKLKPGTQEYYDTLRRQGQAGVSNLSTVGAASGLYYQFDPKTKDKFLSQLGLAGVNVNNLSDGDLADLWGKYVLQAASYYAAGKTNITPWDVLSKDMHQRESYASKPRTVTQTQTAYDMSTRADAQSIFREAAQQLLGRDPTKKEVSSFQTALNRYEQANPSTTTTSTTYKGSEVTGQTSTTTGGVKDTARGEMAIEKAKADPEYGAYQASTTYMDALLEAIGK